MRKISGIISRCLILSFLCMLFPLTAWGRDVYVHGYTRRDGTQVEGHWRSRPDGNPYNNWSSQGNVNPYTGKIGTQDPDRVREKKSRGSRRSRGNTSQDFYSWP